MGVEARLEELAREKGMKTKKQLEEERLNKIKKKEEKKKEKKKGLNYLLNLLNKRIVLVFLDNERKEGTLKSFNNYEICLETQENSELIIFKHAIKFLHEKPKDV